jgi:predicted RNA binding protein YcfA (HicA-like mRNA interferase family)
LTLKVRDLISELEKAGFVNRGGKGSHRNFVHGHCSRPVTISGSLGDDAKHYQIRAVQSALREVRSEGQNEG